MNGCLLERVFGMVRIADGVPQAKKRYKPSAYAQTGMKGLLMLQRFGTSPVVRYILCSSILICFAHNASSQISELGHCVVELPISEDVVPGRYGFSLFSRAVTVPGFEYPFIDLDASAIATFVDDKLVPFSFPPLDQSNAAMPELVRQQDGSILGYNRVEGGFYILSPKTGTFRPLNLTGLDEIQSVTAYASLQAKAKHSEPSHGSPRMYGFLGQQLERLALITDTAMTPVDLPERWRPGGFPPAYIPGLGFFVEAQGTMMFRRSEDAEWTEISQYTNVIGLMANRPMQSLHAHLSDNETFFLRLSDRVLVGRFDEAEDRPEIVYQAAGKQIVHEPTGQVLIFPDEPYGSNWARNRPALANMKPVLHELQSHMPLIPDGDRIEQQFSGTVPFHQWMYHPESERTLIAHRLGVAAFDGDRVVDLEIFSQFSKFTKVFQRVGPKIIMHAIGRGFFEITHDLETREIFLPASGGSIGIEYSASLDSFIARSSSWTKVYLSHDLRSFHPANGDVEGIVSYIGDFFSGLGAILVARDAVYAVQACTLTNQTR